MNIHVVKLPDVGEGVAEAEIVEWQVAEGDIVSEDQTLAAVMTDKATVEVPSPVSGRIIARSGDVGTVLAVGSTLITIELSEAGNAAETHIQYAVNSSADTPHAPAPSHERDHGKPKLADTSTTGTDELVAEVQGASTSSTRPVPKDPSDAGRANGPLASPAVRRRALDAGIDIRFVHGSGPAGRITHADIERFETVPKKTPAMISPQRSLVEEINVVGLRRRIAERMTETNRSIAHFSYIEEIDVTSLETLRTGLNKRHTPARIKLTLLPFIIRAVVVAIDEFPRMNALYDDTRQVIARHAAIHVGIATQTPSGLVVPVLRHAEECDLWSCASEIKRLSEAARNGSSTREDLSGSTITVTSLGSLGGIATTPVVNRPEVAIIGVNRIAVRPVWQDGQFVPRKIMNLSSSFDHRVIDGHEAALFVQRIKSLLEIPAAMFIRD